MAFQNNSGDIILDVVLTDEGRRLLALGGGDFEITQFALGDDEINYALFETGSTTALQDLSILQTPILEAFTNNTSMMKSKLLSLTDSSLLYLPVLRLNTLREPLTAQNNFVVCVDSVTWDDSSSTSPKSIGVDSESGERDGFIYGASTDDSGAHIVVDSGIDSTDITQLTDGTPIETSFMIQIDNRLGSIVSKDGTSSLSPTSIDDDNVATYLIQSNPAGGSTSWVSSPSQENYENNDTPINGPISKRLLFKIRSSEDLRVSNFLFNRIGSTISDSTYAHDNVKIIDSIVRVSGITTGYSLDIPVRFAKSV